MTYSGGTRLDLYPFKEKIYPCSWPYHFKEGENETSIFMEGRWTKVPKNPARHLRGLSSNYLKHATWTLARFIRTLEIEKFPILQNLANVEKYQKGKLKIISILTA